MINSDYRQSNIRQNDGNPINSNSIPSNNLMLNNGGFHCIEEDGKIIYHWIDTAIEHLSSTKLWDILRLAKIPNCGIDQNFASQVINELKLRNHFDENQPWMKPH
jgi:hypothetical protein